MKEKIIANKKFLLFLLGSFLLVVVDFVSKWLVQIYAPFQSEVEVIKGFFYIYKDYNTGIAFSIGADWPTWLGRGVNILISVVLSALIFVYWYKNRKDISVWHHVSGMLLFGGAIGNFIDRACYWKPVSEGGPFGVIDFLRFYIFGKNNKPFATFNLADAFLTVGIAILIVVLIVDTVKAKEKDYSENPLNKEQMDRKDEDKNE